MSKQILFCVETSKKAKTDKVYIDETIEKFYILGNDIRKRYVYMNGKSNYNKARVIKEINDQTRQYAVNGPSTVIYFIDTDKYDSDPAQAKEVEVISKYCQDKNYEFIWFCRDVEDVFWGEQVPKDEKKDKAAQFRSSKRIRDISEEKLNRKNFSRHYSNILTILDKHLERKCD